MIKINLGCGWRNFGKDWIHIDGGDYLHLDSKNIINLPYKDNSADLIYASHVIEYFNREEIEGVLNEWIRVLKPNGKLRLAVPNFKEMVTMYLNGDINLESILGPLYGKMIVLNNCHIFSNFSSYKGYWPDLYHANFFIRVYIAYSRQ